MKKFLLGFFGIFLLLTVAATYYLYLNLLPLSDTINEQAFVINQGEGLSLIGKRLQKAGFIKDPNVFMVYAYYLGLNTKLQAGSFRLSPHMTLSEIVQKLSKGGSHDYWLKILPGNRIEEIAAKFATPESTIDPKQFIHETESVEGYLFPDSYLIPENYTSQDIISLISNNFNAKIGEVASAATNADMDQKEIVILASIIEREARTLESKKMVAGILINRQKIDMPLQVDASVQYAKDSNGYKKLGENWYKYDFWAPIASTDLDIVSPYNTYTNPGLPPSPICNPGIDSLTAAYNPTPSDYLFYITGNDNQMHYAKTLDEHNTNIRKYLR